MKKVLVYPCGTEIGLEIYRSLCYSTRYKVYGGSSTYDHGRFVFKEHIDGLPFITDESTEQEIIKFNEMIEEYGFDFIYPAMDGVLTVFSKYKSLLSPEIIAPDHQTTEITRSKRKTYALLNKVIPTPMIYEDKDAIKTFPVFVKPDVGQGAVGAKKINNSDELRSIDLSRYVCLEYLPGNEFTVDCFTNENGELLFAKARGRKRIKGGISVNSVFENKDIFFEYAEKINSLLKQSGGWFFQMKESVSGELKLLEVSSRIAGSSSITRCIGVNLPMLSLDIHNGLKIGSVMPNDYYIESDRALSNNYKIELNYSTVYMDYDDTVVDDNKVNLLVIKFIYQCLNNNKRVVLLSKHSGDLDEELKKYRLTELFDEVIHIEREAEKKDHITDKDSIFIDDSYNERRKIKEAHNIPVFDTHMIECLLED